MWNDLKNKLFSYQLQRKATPPPIQWPPSVLEGRRWWSCRGQRRERGGAGKLRSHPSRLPRSPDSWFSHVWDKDFNLAHQLTWRWSVQSGACVPRTGFCWAIIHPPFWCEVALPLGSGSRWTSTKKFQGSHPVVTLDRHKRSWRHFLYRSEMGPQFHSKGQRSFSAVCPSE